MKLNTSILLTLLIFLLIIFAFLIFKEQRTENYYRAKKNCVALCEKKNMHSRISIFNIIYVDHIQISLVAHTCKCHSD